MPRIAAAGPSYSTGTFDGFDSGVVAVALVEIQRHHLRSVTGDGDVVVALPSKKIRRCWR